MSVHGVVLALDVDGVLAADPERISGGEQALRALGYEPHQYDGPGPDGNPVQGVVWLNRRHGVWLRQLRLRGFELVWASSWGQRAGDWIAPQLGLPVDLPVIEVPRYGPAFGWSAKCAPIRDWVGDRPLAWIDDVFGGKEPGWAEDRSEQGIPTLIIQADPGRGLERAHVDALMAWIDNQATSVGAAPAR